MPLQDTEALTIEVSSAAESFPDPTTVDGRTHLVVNTGTVTAVLSSVGATPFSIQGTPLANVSLPRGQSIILQSNGTRWVVAPSQAGRRIFAASGLTDGSGAITFAFTPPFNAVPVVTNALGPDGVGADATECRITALSASSVTFAARRSPAVTVLGISVLSASVPAVGARVHVTAIESGQGV